MRWLADNDPVRMAALEGMPLIEYWFLLAKKVEETERAVKEAKEREMRNQRK